MPMMSSQTFSDHIVLPAKAYVQPGACAPVFDFTLLVNTKLAFSEIGFYFEDG